jgi:EmrB/QacA subfamily drug resistance transporter
VAVPAGDRAAYDRRWWTLSVLCLSLVVIVGGNSSLNVALPSLQRALHASTSSLQWIVDIYSLVFAGLLLPAGALADRYGRKTALQLGLIVFGLASLAATFATATWQLIVLRAVTGAGAAFIMPGTLSILANTFPPPERPKAISIWAGFSGLGAGIGPIASGVLLKHFWWGSVFFINVPTILIALTAGIFLVPNSKDPEDTVLDPPGVALIVTGLCILLYGIIQAPERGWGDPVTLAALVLGLVLLVAFVSWELHTARPMLDMRLFRIRPFSVGAGTITMQFFVMFGFFFIFAQYFQLARLYSALSAALATLPLAVCLMFGAPVSARMVARFGARRVVGTGLLVTALGFGMVAFLRPHSPFLLILVSEVLIGVGVGQTTAPSTTLIMSSVRMANAGVGSAVNDTSRELGGALGVAVLGSILNSYYRGNVVGNLPKGLPQGVVDAAHGSLAGALVAAKALPPDVAKTVTDAARSTFSSASGVAALVGALLLVATSACVWIFQDRHAPPAGVHRDAATGSAPATSNAAALQETRGSTLST